MSVDEPTDERRDDAATQGTDDGLSLSPDLEVVAQLLAEGQSDASAGGAVGRSAKFVQRARRGDPAFAARVREMKEARAAQAAAGLGALLDDALEAVRRGLEAEKAADQLRAAALVLDRFRVYRSDIEAAEKIMELETQIGELRSTVTAMGGRSQRGAES